MAKEQTNDTLNDALSMMAQILSEMRTQKTATPDALETLAKGIEQLVQAEKTKTKENQFHPDFSFFNPLGEKDNPRPNLRCKMIWVGHKLTKEGLTREEIEYLNRIPPGHYWVTKADGKRIKFDVVAREDELGRTETLSFHFPCKTTEDRHNHGSMLSYLREALGESLPRVEYLLAEIDKLKAELATK
jgi:hypothetical protein